MISMPDGYLTKFNKKKLISLAKRRRVKVSNKMTEKEIIEMIKGTLCLKKKKGVFNFLKCVRDRFSYKEMCKTLDGFFITDVRISTRNSIHYIQRLFGKMDERLIEYITGQSFHKSTKTMRYSLSPFGDKIIERTIEVSKNGLSDIHLCWTKSNRIMYNTYTTDYVKDLIIKNSHLKWIALPVIFHSYKQKEDHYLILLIDIHNKKGHLIETNGTTSYFDTYNNNCNSDNESDDESDNDSESDGEEDKYSKCVENGMELFLTGTGIKYVYIRDWNPSMKILNTGYNKFDIGGGHCVPLSYLVTLFVCKRDISPTKIYEKLRLLPKEETSDLIKRFYYGAYDLMRI
jgi:hypothetical protein